MEEYDKVATAFQKFFNHDELSKVLDQKQDKYDLYRKLKTKSSTEELDSALKLIDSLY
jgi:hypothetical protein